MLEHYRRERGELPAWPRALQAALRSSSRILERHGHAERLGVVPLRFLHTAIAPPSIVQRTSMMFHITIELPVKPRLGASASMHTGLRVREPRDAGRARETIWRFVETARIAAERIGRARMAVLSAHRMGAPGPRTLQERSRPEPTTGALSTIAVVRQSIQRLLDSVASTARVFFAPALRGWSVEQTALLPALPHIDLGRLLVRGPERPSVFRPERLFVHSMERFIDRALVPGVHARRAESIPPHREASFTRLERPHREALFTRLERVLKSHRERLIDTGRGSAFAVPSATERGARSPKELRATPTAAHLERIVDRVWLPGAPQDARRKDLASRPAASRTLILPAMTATTRTFSTSGPSLGLTPPLVSRIYAAAAGRRSQDAVAAKSPAPLRLGPAPALEHRTAAVAAPQEGAPDPANGFPTTTRERIRMAAAEPRATRSTSSRETSIVDQISSTDMRKLADRIKTEMDKRTRLRNDRRALR